jgi:hypothetical protein
MPRTCEAPPSRALSADGINEQIRAFLRPRLGRALHDDEAEVYGRLRDQWCAATQAEVVKAA